MQRKTKLSKHGRMFVLGCICVVFLAVIIVIASVTASHKNAHVRFDFTATFGDAEIVNGIDVSHHNGEIDWKKVKGHSDFAIIRAGYRGYGTGKIVTDDTFEDNIKGAVKDNMPVGVYFYTQAVTKEEAKEEADYVIKLVENYEIKLPIFIDYEYPYSEQGDPQGRLYDANLTPAKATDVVNAFCKEVSANGYSPGIYASSSTMTDELEPDDFVPDAIVWVADYNTGVTFAGEYDIWQYTETGSCPGVSSNNVDMDKWYAE